jgi:hydroxyacylglutathione hydrolase
MKAEQFRYSKDNLGYIIHGESSAIAVDGGATDEILDFLEKSGLKLILVTNTHSHGDHTCGNEALLSATGSPFAGPAEILAKEKLELEGSGITIIRTPGHTADSVCFYYPGTLLSGDTLFGGKVGRCFTRDVEGFYRSIRKLLDLPGETVVYSGHDYVEEYLEFDRMVEPSNSFIDEYAGKYDPLHVWSTLDDEKRVDPFLHLSEASVISFLEARGLPSSTEMERWESLISVM